PRRGTLTLAEVEVWSDGENVAPKGRATQSSTAHGGEASRAIDGNRSGAYSDGGQTHTQENRRNTWWELDLGRDFPVEAVTLWTRSEDGGRFAVRLQGFDLRLLDGSRTEVFSHAGNPAPEESVRVALKGDVAGAIRRAAVAAIVRTGQEQAAVFAALCRMIREDDQRMAASAAIRQLPRSVWTAAEAGETAKALLRWAATAPAGERTRQDYIELTQLGDDFSGYLGNAEAAELRRGFRELSVAVFVVKTVVEQLRFDTERLVVEAGNPFEIRFENNDNLPHNLLFIRPGTRLEIGTLAQVMLPDRLDRQGRAYFPDHPGIIDGTKLLEPGQKETLQLDAPDAEGEYEMVCTFPGHWTLMWGRIVVTRDVEAYLKENPVAPPAGPAALAEPSEQ
ncbi:MAG TPA: plastocyanin/azurin family copper-binding protein, partial [Verrucomicrobiales bacterium]|nr:plastocyanin/azurin family copper-binding protein [Verrucomicrobiales bacterium]